MYDRQYHHYRMLSGLMSVLSKLGPTATTMGYIAQQNPIRIDRSDQSQELDLPEYFL